MEHFCVKFGDTSCIGFWDVMQKTDIQTNGSKKPYPATVIVWVRDQNCMSTMILRHVDTFVLSEDLVAVISNNVYAVIYLSSKYKT